MGAVVKYEGAVCRYHSVGELASAIEGMSRDGFRIINVLDRSSNHQDTFLVIAQKDVDAHVHIAGGPSEDIRFGTNDR
jgi:hypothetical protein